MNLSFDPRNTRQAQRFVNAVRPVELKPQPAQASGVYERPKPRSMAPVAENARRTDAFEPS